MCQMARRPLTYCRSEGDFNIHSLQNASSAEFIMTGRRCFGVNPSRHNATCATIRAHTDTTDFQSKDV
jgi:hypothetical protein